MSRIRVENEVRIYEVGGKRTTVSDHAELLVRSHWNRDELVILETPEGVPVTVVAKDLELAIRNATNTR